MPAYKLQRIEPQQDMDELRRQLEAELKLCTNVAPTYRNKAKKFMMAEGIWHIADLDYPARERYEKFLAATICEGVRCTYLKAFDRIKLAAINAQLKLMPKEGTAPVLYENKVFFLPYYPDPAIAGRFEKSVKKKDLVWDFSRAAPENMKRQIFAALDYQLRNWTSEENQRVRLISLRRLYDFCTEEGIEDIEGMELEDIRRFTDTLIPLEQRKRVGSIVDFCRKALFMQADEIKWDAPVWYMERFHIQPERLNPSNPVRCMSFLEVINKRNRKLLQKYTRFGITNLALSNLRTEFLYVRRFLEELNQPEDEDVCTITPEQIAGYFKKLKARSLQPASYNDIVMAILHFFQFLLVRQYIKRIPFDEEYYLKKEIYNHKDRSVAPDTAKEIMAKLSRFPEEIRLMYLHLWAVGLRISEVCALKGNAYYIQGRDAWMQIYQIKMRTYKRIPIPDALYQLMQVYIKKNHIQANDYVFQNRRGGAYNSGTFRKKMLECCAENHIQNGEYLFKSHDFRHTIATSFYEEGVPLQSIRDYLGHIYEEMTQQYIDYMPRKIKKANTEYFGRHGSLAAGLLNKEGGKENG